MPGLKALVVLALCAQLVLLLTLRQSTAARFVDQSQTSTNTFVAKTMQTPGLTATGSGASVTLGWTNPDALTGANASFIVQRASGDCAAPGAFAPLAGSPFPATAVGTSDAPGAGGTYCYAVQSALYSWRSAAATTAATVHIVTVPKLRLLAADPGVCGAVGSLSTGVGASNVVVAAHAHVIFAAAASEGLTSVPAGAHTVTLLFPGSPSGGSVAYTVEVGTCSGTTFTALGSVSDSFVLGRADQTRVMSVATPRSVTVGAGAYLALRVTNGGASNFKLTGNQAESTLEAPSGAGY